MQNIDKKSHRTFHFLRESQCQCVKTLKNPSVFGEGSSNPVISTLQIFFYNNNKKSNTFQFLREETIQQRFTFFILKVQLPYTIPTFHFSIVQWYG